MFGLTHGNEICGAIAIDKLLRADLRPRRGKLTLGFGTLVGFTLLVVAQTFVAGRNATSEINLSEEIRGPASLTGKRYESPMAGSPPLGPG